MRLSMEFQQLYGSFMDNLMLDFVKYVWPVLAVPILWLFKQVNELKADYYETKIHAAQTYISRSDYREDLKSLHLKIDAHAERQNANMNKILDKLDGKADK